MYSPVITDDFVSGKVNVRKSQLLIKQVINKRDISLFTKFGDILYATIMGGLQKGGSRIPHRLKEVGVSCGYYDAKHEN